MRRFFRPSNITADNVRNRQYSTGAILFSGIGSVFITFKACHYAYYKVYASTRDRQLEMYKYLYKTDNFRNLAYFLSFLTPEDIQHLNEHTDHSIAHQWLNKKDDLLWNLNPAQLEAVCSTVEDNGLFVHKLLDHNYAHDDMRIRITRNFSISSGKPPGIRRDEIVNIIEDRFIPYDNRKMLLKILIGKITRGLDSNTLGEYRAERIIKGFEKNGVNIDTSWWLKRVETFSDPQDVDALLQAVTRFTKRDANKRESSESKSSVSNSFGRNLQY